MPTAQQRTKRVSSKNGLYTRSVSGICPESNATVRPFQSELADHFQARTGARNRARHRLEAHLATSGPSQMSLKTKTNPDAVPIEKQALPPASIPRIEVSDTRPAGDRKQRSRDHKET